MPPVNTTSGLGSVHSTHPPHLMIPAASFEHPSISYIDLDLPKTTSPTTKNNSINRPNFETLKVQEKSTSEKHEASMRQKTGNAPDSTQVCSNSSVESKTIYKTVDFAKTIALNRTKRDIESEREQAISDQFSSGGGIAGAVGSNILLNR